MQTLRRQGDFPTVRDTRHARLLKDEISLRYRRFVRVKQPCTHPSPPLHAAAGSSSGGKEADRRDPRVRVGRRRATAGSTRGRGVGVAAEEGTIIVRHQPCGGMPAMTMPFAVSRAILRTVRPRDVIEGTVVEAGSPWSLRDVRVIGVARPERYVPVLQTGALVPDIPLVDQRGKPFSLRSSRGRL